MASAAFPRVSEPGEYAGHEIAERQNDQSVLRETNKDRTDQRKEGQKLERMTRSEIEFLAAPEAPTADHQEAGEENQSQPHQ